VHYLVKYAPILPIEAELLTTRQREIFHLIVVGLSNKEIARKLGIGEGTVKIHVAKLFDKLGVRHRSAVDLAGAMLGLRPSVTVLVGGRTMSQLILSCAKTGRAFNSGFRADRDDLRFVLPKWTAQFLCGVCRRIH
jgi:DNA-binding CsgD family transcriptional regulator